MNIQLNEDSAKKAGIPISDNLKNLHRRREQLAAEARAALDKLDDNASPAEVRKFEKRHDELMAEIDAIDERIEREADFAVRDRRPISRDGGSAPAAVGHGADYRDTEPTEVFALRSNQSFERHVVDQNMEDRSAMEVSQVSTGAFLRAMVLGPKNEIERRTLVEGTDSAGGYTVPVLLSARMIDRMRAASVIFRAGAQIVPLASDVNHMAKVATDPVPGWRNENGPVAESDPTFSRVTFTPRSLMVLVKVSRELLEDSLNMEAILPELLITAMAKELDRVALAGSGAAPQPRGVLNFSGLTANGFGGGVLSSYAPLITARTALRSVNSDVTAFVLHPRDEGTFAGLTSSVDAQPLMIPPALSNIPMLTTTAIPTNLGSGTDESVILAGDWSRLMIGVRSKIQVGVSRELYLENNQYGFLAHMRVDIAAEDEKAFTVLEGITLT